MEIAVLGPLRVRASGSDIAISAPKERALLACLALNASRAVSSAQLIEALWGENPPRSAHKAIQMYVSNLRQVLPEKCITTTIGGYCLAVSADDVDARQFEELAAHGRRRLLEGDSFGAERALREALALWRGAPFVELTCHPIGAAWAAHVEELRHVCEEDLVEARIALGEHGSLVADLEMAVAAQPLRERRWGQLMRALYGEGRQAEALRAFQRLRKALSDELGIDPSSELRELELAILTQDPRLVSINERSGHLEVEAATPSTDFLTKGAASRPHLLITRSESANTDTDAPGHGDLVLPDSTEQSGAALETTTVLFTDLVDSTARSATLSPDAADQWRRHHFSLLRTTTVNHNGTFVKSLGDGVMAVFSSPSEALSCAVAMQQGVEHDGRGTQVQSGIRIGISAGEVIHEEGDYFGDPVVEAARLCDVAQQGQVLVASVVRMLAGRRTVHDLSPVADIALKGFPGPVSAMQLNWLPLPTGEAPIPLPRTLATHHRIGFFGRTLERELLARATKTAEGGQRTVALVAGAPGIGKTTLLATEAEELFHRGATVLYGRCDEDLRLPYQPFVEALTHFVTHAPAELLAEHVAAHGGELVRLVPTLSRRVARCPAATATEPDAERHLAFGAAVGLLQAALRRAPVVVVLDDLHWADKPSLLLLRYLVAAPELAGSSLILMGSYRSSEMARSHELSDALVALRRDAEVTRIQLAGLSDEEVLELAESAAGHQLDEESIRLARTVRRETGGNPFFVLEMLRHLAESGAVVQDNAGHWSTDSHLEHVGLPQSIKEVVAQRVRRLGELAERVMSVAAVIGPDFDVELLGQVTGLEVEEVLTVTELAETASLVVEGPEVGGYAFEHALVQQTLYEGLGSVRRQRIHRRVAEALELRGGANAIPHVRALCLHWGRAGEADKALHYAQRAGQAALDGLAPDDAVGWFGQALRILAGQRPANSALRCDLLIGLGSAQRAAGDPSYRQTLLEAGDLARTMDDPSRMAEAALASYRGFWSSAGRVDTDKVSALEATLTRMPDVDSRERARLLATLCNELTFSSPPERRRAIADEARAMALRLGESTTIVQVLTAVFDALLGPSTLSERLADTELAQTLAEAHGDPVACFSAARYRWRATVAAGLIEEADRCLERMQVLSGDVRQPTLIWITTFARACRALLAGDTDEAEDLVSEAYRVGIESGQPDAQVFYEAGLSHVRWQQGRLGEFVAVVEQAATANPGIPGHWAALARSLCDAERAHEARPLLEDASNKKFAHLPEDSLRLSGLVMYAETAMYLSEAGPAKLLFSILEPWSAQWSFMGIAVDGPVDHFLGGLATVLGEFDEAETHFATALDMGGRAGAKFFIARTELEWARMLILRGGAGDLEQANLLLRRAGRAAEAEGYAVVARRAQFEFSRRMISPTRLVPPQAPQRRPSARGGAAYQPITNS